MAEKGSQPVAIAASPSDGANKATVPEAAPQFSAVPFEDIHLPPVIPGHQSWPDKIAALRRVTLRDDDVILMTYPKTGTHWLWETISMLLKGKAEHAKSEKGQFIMEFVHTDVLQQQSSPRTLNTHLRPNMLPLPEMKARRVKTVHLYRNPKDTCVSMFHMAKVSPKMMGCMPVGTFAEFFEFYFFSEKMLFGPYLQYLKKMHDFQTANPEVPTFNVSFESVKKDPVDSVERLATFLGLQVSGELCVQIADECSFDTMKRRASEKAQPQMIVPKPDAEAPANGMKNTTKSFMYRKGQIGDWKNYFTVAMSERVDVLLKEEIKDLPFTFTFE